MALRLTGTTAPAPRPSTPAELAAQATSMLAAGNHAGYAELFTRAENCPGLSAAYHARVLLVEQGLQAARTAAAAQATQIFLTIATALVHALGDEPREPVLLNYAGVALYELWSLDAAKEMFKAAQRLDPALPHLKRNLSEVARRHRGRGPAHLRPLHVTLPDLARQAKRVAAQARPAAGLTLSLCMIVRDEEEMLPRCLAAAAPAVDEIVIVDTGSTDRTVEIARSFGARVIEREWTGSFAEARNVSFEAATGDWLIYLDADEVLVAEDVARLRALTGRVWREAFYLLETSYTGEDGDGTSMIHPALRVFRNRPEYRFEGRMHEQIAHNLPTQAPGRIEQSVVRVTHYGYLGSVRDAKEKSRRNIELLRTQQREGNANAFLHFNLGTEYAAVGDASSALSELEQAWKLVESQGEQGRDYVPTLLVRLASALRTCGRLTDAIELADRGLASFPGFTDLVFARGLGLLALGRAEEARAAWERCLEMGDAPARYGATVGAGTYLPLQALADLHRRRGELPEARALLERCLDEHPSFVGAVGPYASVLLDSGLAAAEVVAEVVRHVADPPPSVRLVLAGSLHAHRALEEAAEQYRAILAKRPRSSQIRTALAELLLGLGANAEAREIIAAVDPGDPFASQAARIELWSVIAAGRLEEIPTAHTRAQRAGLSAAELEVFAAWAALAAGAAPRGALGVAGLPLLGVILETLLGAHDFTAFERLLPLLHGSALPAREQRELLATMYLRYGFLQSAGREWMTVCETAPDARAMTGLAQVALAHGLRDDARTFAAQALALDGDSLVAQRILALDPTGAEDAATVLAA